MKIKKFHGNITILTLFILLASALMWVLVALYMKNFIRYSDEITSYEKTSYLAKAGTELWLAIVWSREVWLVYSIDSWNAIMWNFECPFPVEEGKECPVDPKFSIDINWLWTNYNNCTDTNTVEIKPWLSAIIPLFKDSWLTNNDVINALKEWWYTNRLDWHERNITAKGDASPRRFWIVRINNEDTLILRQPVWNNINNIWDANRKDMDHAYLIAANPSLTDSKKICIKWKEIPQETVKIISIGYYNGRQLWTETLTTKSLPSFLQWDNYIY